MILIFLAALQLISQAKNQQYYPNNQEMDSSEYNKAQNHPLMQSEYQNHQPTDLSNHHNSKKSRTTQKLNMPLYMQNYKEPNNYGLSQETDGIDGINQNNLKDKAERQLQLNDCLYDQYFDNSTELCFNCREKFAECLTCNEAACLSCNNNKHLNSDGECFSCPTFCSLCNQTDCIKCQSGYFMDNDGDCIGCIQYCEKCNETSCLSCSAAFFLDEYGKCSLCSSKFVNCNSCSESACLKCIGGYALNIDGKCIECPIGCEDCNGGKCNSCNAGYQLDANDLCTKCQNHCNNCYNSVCFQCDSYYYLDSSGKCNECTVNCPQCNETSCTGCEEGFYLELDNECHRCTEKYGELCRRCNELTCVNCLSSYFIGADGTCIKCTDKYEGCNYCDSRNCYQCHYSYYMDLNHRCSRCGSGCERCLNSAICTSCLNDNFPYSDGTCECNTVGFYFNSTTKWCEPCSEGCRICTSATNCIKCGAANMINNGDGTCSCLDENFVFTYNRCTPCWYYGCKTCKRLTIMGYNYDSFNILCASCVNGAYLIDGSCPMCQDGCSECADWNRCTKCIDSDMIIINDSNEKKCVCISGYWWDYYSKSCKPCLSGCASCDSYTYYCNYCFDAKYMIKNWDGTCSCPASMVYNNVTFRCEILVINCAEYGNSGCSKCEEGYFLYDNSGVLECLSCSESCDTCDPHPGCFLCGTAIKKEESTCASLNTVGYLLSFEDGNLIVDFAYDLPGSLSLKDVTVTTPGNYDTSSWSMTQITPRKYMIATNLQESDLPIDVSISLKRIA